MANFIQGTGESEFLSGTSGDDRIAGGAGDDHMLGDAGNDTLSGDAGRDFLDGGEGADMFLFGRGDGQDTVKAGWSSTPGVIDTLCLGAGISLADVDFSAQNGSDLLLKLRGSSDSVTLANYFGQSFDSRPLITFADGSSLNGMNVDNLVNAYGLYQGGTPQSEMVLGSRGDDQLNGVEGDDTLYGAAGRDFMDGGQGADTYLFGRGDGQDTIVAYNGGTPGVQDTVRLGSGISLADVDVSMQYGSDLLLKLRGGTDSVMLAGYFSLPFDQRPLIAFADGSSLNGMHVDTLVNTYGTSQFGTQQSELVVGGRGDDQLNGMDGDDTLYGAAGRDFMDGGQGADTYLFGRGDGQDTIVAYSEGAPGIQDTVRLGRGISLADVDVSMQYGSDLLLKLRGGTDSVTLGGYFNTPFDRRPLITFADGSSLNGMNVDNLVNAYSANQYGTPQAEMLVGSRGDDQLSGMEGDDTLYGDAGRDVMDGGLGADTYLFGRGDGQDTVTAGWVDAPGVSDTLRLGAGISLADVDLSTQNGSDLLLKLRDSSDSMTLAGYFNTPFDRRPLIAFADGSSLNGMSVDNLVNAYNAYQYGTPQAEMLVGSRGDDQLSGMEGDDTLYGDAGRDVMDGGQGADTYLFGRGDGQDTVMDGWGDAPGVYDTLRFGSGISLADVDVGIQNGSDLLLKLRGSSDSVTLSGYFNTPFDRRQLIVFADGSSLNGMNVDNLVNAYSANQYGTPQAEMLVGSRGDDQLMGQEGDDTLYGAAGRDFMDGGQGADTYLFGRGDGQDTVMTGWGDAPGVYDTVRFGSGISLADVDVSSQNGGDLLLKLRGSSDSMTLSGYFNTPFDRRPLIAFADGSSLNGMSVDNLVNAYGLYQGGTPQSETVVGSRGDDQLSGMEGDDTLYGDAGRDVLDGGQGADTYLFGRGDGQDTVTAGWGDAPVDIDTLRLGAGISLADVDFSVQNGSDLLLKLRGSSDSVTLSDYFYTSFDRRPLITFADGSSLNGMSVDNLVNAYGLYQGGTPQSETLVGGRGDDQLSGKEGDDTLYGDAGSDFMDGGQGADTYLFGRGDGQDTIVAYGGYGDSPGTSDTLRLGAGISLADVDVSSQNGSDLLLKLRGSSDSVTLSDYFYTSFDRRPLITFADGSSLNGIGVDNLVWGNTINQSGSPQAEMLVGSRGDDQLMGQEGDDTLYGAAGRDFMDGGQGADTYLFGRGDGQDTMMAGWGDAPGITDYLRLGSGISLADLDFSSQNGDLLLQLKGSSDSVTLSGYFNTPFDRRPLITFTDGSSLNGMNVDNLVNAYGLYQGGTPQSETVVGGRGDDQLSGMEGDDTLYGDAGRDFMDGGQGADTYLFGRGDGQDTVMAGWGDAPGVIDTLRLGSDISLADVDLSAQNGDLLITLFGSSDSVTLSGYFNTPFDRTPLITFADGLSLNAASAGNLAYGTGVYQFGTPQAEVLVGSHGDDQFNGMDGDDKLYGGAGRDFLDGGQGADTMAGGADDDTYIVDNTGDVVVERLEADSAISYDTIQSSVSYTVPDYVEAITLTGTDDINATANNAGCDLTGNTGNNHLKGGDGLDFIFGDDGIDTLEGGAGDDYYYLTSNEDVVIEQTGGGLDQIWAYGDGIKMDNNVERLYMQSYLARTAYGNEGNNLMAGNNRANTLYGNGGNDKLFGYSGDDTIYGGLGNDSLYGSIGNDTYHFQRGDGADTIYDLDATVGNQDKLLLDGAIDASQVWLAKSGNDLVVSVIGTTDKVTINNWYVAGLYQVESIVAGGNGKTLSAANVQNLVNAMASFTPPAAGQTTLPANYQASLNNVIAANWA